MGLPQSNADLEAFLDDMMVDYPIEKRRMFGCPAYFFRGNMMGGVFGDSVFLRFSEKDRESLMADDEEISHFDPLGGRPMREYLSVPESSFPDIGGLSDLVDRSFDHVLSLSPKRAV